MGAAYREDEEGNKARVEAVNKLVQARLEEERRKKKLEGGAASAGGGSGGAAVVAGEATSGSKVSE